MSADVQRSIRRTRAIRRAAILGAALNAFALAVNLADGSALAFAPAAGIVALLVLVVMQTRLIGDLRTRERELNRPRMTPEDYRHLREMETELGWEPSEVPESLAAAGAVALEPREPAACDCGKSQEEHAREWDEQVIASQGIPQATGPALAGTGSLSAKTAWDDVAYASEASQHFAALARVGREHCASYCPICLYRLLGPLPDGVKPDASIRQWLEKNWGWEQ
jgi:hypothetical protein